MAELLFEIHSEEIPARMQARAAGDLVRLFQKRIKKAGLDIKSVRSFAGPRRLTLVTDLPLRSPDISEERKGPQVGSPKRAIKGFLRATGLSDISEAEIRPDKKGAHYLALVNKSGEATPDILARVLPGIMNEFPWPKSMKSGARSFRWIRPLSSLLCLFNGKVIDFEVGGVKTGNQTFGHRRMGRGPFPVTDFKDYQKTLEGKGKIILSAQERKKLILGDAQALCSNAGLELVADEGLLNEVAGLAERPVVLLGDMDERFLELPSEVIRLTMRTHQKYFTVRDGKSGKLAPHFIVVANQIAPDGGEAIAAGNARVLSARLADAQFFMETDRADTLESRFEKLQGLVFHEKLGTVKDKAGRVAALARELASKVDADPDKADTAARLAKCDLVTRTVIEFPSLQGQIGRVMYECNGGDSDIALAIEEHYKPQGPGDTVPTHPVSVAVALADKLDTLVGFWAIDEKPTGSRDPYALRRAVLGLIQLVLKNRVRLQFRFLVGQILAYALRFGFKLGNGEQSDFYANLGRSYDLQTATPPEFPTWGVPPYLYFVNGDGIVSGYAQEIATAQTGFPSHDFPMDRKQEKESDIGDKYLDILRERLRELDSYTHALQDSDYSRHQIISRYSHDKYPLVAEAGNAIFPDIFRFILNRLKVYLRDQGIKHDVIDSVYGLGGEDLVDIANRITALQAFLETGDGVNLLAGYKRAVNILKAESRKGGMLPNAKPGRGTHKEETALYVALEKARSKIDKALEKEDYAGAMKALAALRQPIDTFFDEVTVDSGNAKERTNRLALLVDIRATARRVADFDKLEGSWW